MSMLSDMLHNMLHPAPRQKYGDVRDQLNSANKDTRGAIPPMDNGESKGRTQSIQSVIDSQKPKDPAVIYDDTGKAVGYNDTWTRKLAPDVEDAIKRILKNRSDAGDGGDSSNPFVSAVEASRSNNNTGTPVLKQLWNSMMGKDTNPTDVGSAVQADFGPQSDPAIRSADLPPVDGSIPTPQPRPDIPDYSQPTALNPQDIEQLRTSLLTQAGQMDPSNPNGLSGRMNSPMSESDMGTQRNDAMGIEDSIRGFDGSPKPHSVDMGSADTTGDGNAAGGSNPFELPGLMSLIGG